MHYVAIELVNTGRWAGTVTHELVPRNRTNAELMLGFEVFEVSFSDRWHFIL